MNFGEVRLSGQAGSEGWVGGTPGPTTISAACVIKLRCLGIPRNLKNTLSCFLFLKNLVNGVTAC